MYVCVFILNKLEITTKYTNITKSSTAKCISATITNITKRRIQK